VRVYALWSHLGKASAWPSLTAAKSNPEGPSNLDWTKANGDEGEAHAPACDQMAEFVDHNCPKASQKNLQQQPQKDQEWRMAPNYLPRWSIQQCDQKYESQYDGATYYLVTQRRWTRRLLGL
jgi:hypothetical protein